MFQWTPVDIWRVNPAAVYGQVLGGDFSQDQWILDRMPYRMPIRGLYMSNSVWPLGLSWMAAGYNAATVVAEDLGVRHQAWWRHRPVAWFLENIERLLEPLATTAREPVGRGGDRRCTMRRSTRSWSAAGRTA